MLRVWRRVALQRHRTVESVRFATTRAGWRWATATSAASDLVEAVHECASQLREQHSHERQADLLIVHASGHSTRNIRELFTAAGIGNRHFFGSASRFGPVEASLGSSPVLAPAESQSAISEAVRKENEEEETDIEVVSHSPGARLTATACHMPGVEVKPFHCAREVLPFMGDSFPWEKLQKEAPEGSGSLMLVQANRHCFEEERWLRQLDVAFPFTPKVGVAFASRTGEAERHMCRADARGASHANIEEVDTAQATDDIGQSRGNVALASAVREVNATANVKMKREVMFLDNQRYFSGGTGVLLHGALEVSCFATSSMQRLGPPLGVTELFLGGIFSLNGDFVWSALGKHLEKFGIGQERGSIFAAVVRADNRGSAGARLDPTPQPYRKIVYRSVDWASHESCLFLEGEEISIGDQIQLFRCDLGRGASEMRSLLAAYEKTDIGNRQINALNAHQAGYFAYTSILTPDITNYFYLSGYRQFLDDRMETVDEDIAREQGNAQQSAMLAAGMTQHVSDDTEEGGSDSDSEADASDSPHVVVIGPEGGSDQRAILLDAHELQEQSFPQRLAAEKRAARAKEILADIEGNEDESDIEVGEDERMFVDSSDDEEEVLLDRLEDSLKSLSPEDAVQIMQERPSSTDSTLSEGECGNEALEATQMVPIPSRVAECTESQLATGSYGLGCILPTRKRRRGQFSSLCLPHSTVVVVIAPSQRAIRSKPVRR